MYLKKKSMKIKDSLLSLRINKHILTGYSYVENIILKWQIESCVIAPRSADSKFDENSLFVEWMKNESVA